MKKLSVVLLILLGIGLIISGAIAEETYVGSDYSGESHRSLSYLPVQGQPPKEVPENSDVVYIAVYADGKLKDAIAEALSRVVQSRGLKPVLVEDYREYDLKGRLVVAFFPVEGTKKDPLSREVWLSGVLYYSYPGDAKSIFNSTLRYSLSKSTIDDYASRICQTSEKRAVEEGFKENECGVAYWWNLKAKVGTLTDGDPYELIAEEISSALANMLASK